MTPAEYQRANEAKAGHERAAERARGRLEEIMRRLRDDFGCQSEEDAKALLVEIRADAEFLRRKAEEKWKEYLKKWGERLKEL